MASLLEVLFDDGIQLETPFNQSLYLLLVKVIIKNNFYECRKNVNLMSLSSRYRKYKINEIRKLKNRFFLAIIDGCRSCVYLFQTKFFTLA